jgi:hypothetical protein
MVRGFHPPQCKNRMELSSSTEEKDCSFFVIIDRARVNFASVGGENSSALPTTALSRSRGGGVQGRNDSFLHLISNKTPTTPHCNENPIYVFPEKELRNLSPNFHIHVSVSDLNIPRIGPHIFLQQNRQTDHGITCIYLSQTSECGI